MSAVEAWRWGGPARGQNIAFTYFIEQVHCHGITTVATVEDHICHVGTLHVMVTVMKLYTLLWLLL